MQSSSKPSNPKPATPAKKQQQQQLISAMFPSGPSATGKSITSANFNNLTPAQERIDAVQTKFLRDPQSLTVADLKTLLRAEGKPVSGKKADLLDRLFEDDDYLSMDEDGNPLPPRDMSPSVSHQLRIIPFDGKGSDPALLVGRHIQRFKFDPMSGLEFILHTDQGLVTITYLDIPSRYAEIKADDELLEGLKSIEQIKETLYVGDEEITRAEREMQAKKGGSLLIVEAAVGMRKCPDFGDYRVVGIRCEGMPKMGFVFSEDTVLEDVYGRDPRFGDVAVELEARKPEEG